jgi:hypothetical protein
MDDVRVGQEVRLEDNHQRGWVIEVDHSFQAARVEMNAGGERWVRLDELEVIESPNMRRQLPYRGAQRW